MFEPIVMLAFPRSGSTMAAQLFREHGVWLGQCEGKSLRLPTGGGENIGIKNLLKEMGTGLGEMKPHVQGFRVKVEKLVKEQGYEDGPWLMKHAIAYWRAWNEFSPKFVLVERDKESLLASNESSGMAGVRGVQLINTYAVNLDEMKHIKTFAPTIKTRELIEGDYSSLKNALEHCEIEFDETIPEKVIKTEHWHFR